MTAGAWTQYHLGGRTSRVLRHTTRVRDGKTVELELCGEGGQYVIRRTEGSGKNATRMEAGRGRLHDVEALWALLTGE